MPYRTSSALALEAFETFGDLLKYLRRRARLTQDELARAVGYSREQITKLENHQRAPDPITIKALFLPALDLDDLPSLAARLLELAARARSQARLTEHAPSSASPTSRLTNLSAQLTSFVGREHETADIQHLLTTTRLLALTGAGGAGKTRLAARVGETLLDEFEDGVWLAELALIRDPGLVPVTVASSLRLPSQAGQPPETVLVEYLRARHLLLILDNCEHVLVACAQLAEMLLHAAPRLQLLHAAPRLHLLATSRESLGILSATVYRVPSLTLPSQSHTTPDTLQQSEAVRLFVHRASAAKPGFVLTSHNAPTIAQISRRLDGMPLALELAATWVRALSVEQIAARLDDRFNLLTGGNRSALPRHQTLRALMDWSYDLLSDKERVLLRHLGVFVGGFTLEAVEMGGGADEVPHPATPLNAVLPRSDGGAQAALDTLTQLIDKSLVRVDERDDQTRYFQLETVREYALEKLAAEGQTTSARDRHLAFYMSLVEQAGSELHGANQKYWFTCLDLEHDNVRTALDWAAQRQDVPALWRLIARLWWFWFRRGHWREGVERAMIARSLDDGAHSLAQARALVGAATLAGRNGDYELFRAWLSEGAQLAEEHGDSVYLAWARLNQSIHTGDYIRAKALLEDGLALARAAGDTWLVADLFFILGDRARSSCLGADAAAYYAQSVAHFRRVGDRDMVAYPLGNVGRLALSRGDYAEARAAFEESVAMCREMGNKPGIADWLIQLGRVALHQADEASAQAALGECLALCRETGNASGLGDGLTIAVELALRRGQPERAARWLAVADGLYEQFATDQRVIEPGRYSEHAQRLTVVRAQLSERAFQAAWAAGRALSISEAIEEVLG